MNELRTSQRTLPVGKYYGLQRSSTAAGHFTILAMDHQDALRRVMRPERPENVTPDEMIAFKMEVIGTLGSETSGVLLDPIYAAAQAICSGHLGKTALILELERADYALQPMPLAAEILPNWSVAKMKRMGTSALKLFYYYNSDAPDLVAKQDAMLDYVVTECAVYDLPFFAEPILVEIGEDRATFTAEYTRRQFEAARRAAAIGADILKLEFPVAPALQGDETLCRDTCARLTEALEVPWVLLSAGVTYEVFARQVEIACDSGASGFIGGRAIWGEAALLDHADERQRWLESTGRARLRELSHMAAMGRPWTNLIACEPISTTWYQTYGET